MQKKQRILVIDDDKATLNLFLELAKRVQTDLDISESGAEALRLMKDRTYDLIFLDIHMPEMDGIDVLRAIRQRNPSVPVYLITGFYGRYFEALKTLAAEGIAFELLNKPLEINTLLAIIHGILNGPSRI